METLLRREHVMELRVGGGIGARAAWACPLPPSPPSPSWAYLHPVTRLGSRKNISRPNTTAAMEPRAAFL
jgi:hypothetical protein